ncbi:hypothetical protein GCM10010412_064400 [Nonomuraea recticatena]|uniref:Uncharacterized protein n=1 Tax=Nonomuraea recticatena TaxID=46178 RepID=A0ABN3SLT0_9ACTN
MCTTGKPSASPEEASATGRPASELRNQLPVSISAHTVGRRTGRVGDLAVPQPTTSTCGGPMITGVIMGPLLFDLLRHQCPSGRAPALAALTCRSHPRVTDNRMEV